MSDIRQDKDREKRGSEKNRIRTERNGRVIKDRIRTEGNGGVENDRIRTDRNGSGK